jgi:hypothetical protein
LFSGAGDLHGTPDDEAGSDDNERRGASGEPQRKLATQAANYEDQADDDIPHGIFSREEQTSGSLARRGATGASASARFFGGLFCLSR